MAINIALRYFATFWRSLVLFATPLLAALVFLAGNEEETFEAMKCAYVLIIMAVFWVTEALPVAVTSLIPVAAFPLLGIMSTGSVTINYMKAVNFLFMGGLIMAIGVENSGLHRRISLSLLRLIGTRPTSVMLAFMLTTSFLSMWISNTAATAMMIPIVDAVVTTIDNAEGTPSNDEEELHQPSEREHHQHTGERQNSLSAAGDNRRKMLLLSVAYAANVGGTGVITGSPPNLVLPAQLQKIFGPDQPLTFPRWMLFSIPLMIVNLVLAFLWLSLFQWVRGMWTTRGQKPSEGQNTTYGATNDRDGRTNRNTSKGLKDVLTEEYARLGAWSQQEISIGILFIILVLLWFSRDPQIFPGWQEVFPYENISIHDATAAVLMVLVAFSLPTHYRFWPFQAWSDPIEKAPSLVEWSGEHGVEKRLPWGVIFLLGGGFALSAGCEVSGLSDWVGHALSRALTDVSATTSLIIICTVTAFATEFASNTATANILAPILVETSKKLCLNPIFIAFPAILCCSYAFMLPAATAPNAIVKEASGLRTSTMMAAGLVMNLVCISSTVAAIMGYGGLVFDFGPPLPQWLTNGENNPFESCDQSNGTSAVT